MNKNELKTFLAERGLFLVFLEENAPGLISYRFSVISRGNLPFMEFVVYDGVKEFMFYENEYVDTLKFEDKFVIYEKLLTLIDKF